MEKKFSKGQWLISGSCSDSIRISTENYDVVADVYDGWNSVDKQIDMDICVANAKLIAAAPDLLDRLNKLVLSVKAHPDYVNGEEGDEWHDIVNLAEQTIKKATE